MTNASCRFGPDRSRGLLVIELVGFYHCADRLADQLSGKPAAIARLGLPPNAHLTLCDCSDFPTQSREVFDVLKASMQDPTHAPRRLAVVVRGALARLQLQRIATMPGSACFERRSEALVWLTA